MPEKVEVAIEKALLDRSQAFATANNLLIALPNIKFDPPSVSVSAKYLRATLLPADTATIAIAASGNDQHLGLLQLDVFYGNGGGERAPRRIASDIISYFVRGTRMTVDGFNVDVLQTPRIGPSIKTDSWIFIPVRISYNCFAVPA